MTKTVLDAFNGADIIRFALSDAVTVSNMCSGFRKCGVWDYHSHCKFGATRGAVVLLRE